MVNRLCKFSTATVLLAVLLVSTTVNAALVSVYWQSRGDNLITRDTVSGLDWLDLTETNNMSYVTVYQSLSVGSQFEGWRYATNNEVVSLWENFNIDLSSDALSQVSSLNSDLHIATSYLGNITTEYGYNNEFPVGVLGLTVNSVDQGYQNHMSAYYWNSIDITIYEIDGQVTDIFYLDRYVTTGSYLVRVSEVPVLAAV